MSKYVESDDLEDILHDLMERYVDEYYMTVQPGKLWSPKATEYSFYMMIKNHGVKYITTHDEDVGYGHWKILNTDKLFQTRMGH